MVSHTWSLKLDVALQLRMLHANWVHVQVAWRCIRGIIKPRPTMRPPVPACSLAARAQRHSQASNKQKAAVVEEMSRTAVETESITRWAATC